jgi:hypothetical protein
VNRRANDSIGSATDNEGRHDGPSKGPDSEHFKKNISDQQGEVSWNESGVSFWNRMLT